MISEDTIVGKNQAGTTIFTLCNCLKKKMLCFVFNFLG